MTQKKEVSIEKRLQNAAKSVLYARKYKQLVNSDAWKEMCEVWMREIEDHDESKKIESLFQYAPETVVAFGQDVDGKQRYISGTQYLVIQQRHEIRVDVLKEIMSNILNCVKYGEEDLAFIRENKKTEDIQILAKETGK